VVLDDYHAIAASEVHDAVTFLLDHLPDSLHLVMATRSDPPLPLARLRSTRPRSRVAGRAPEERPARILASVRRAPAVVSLLSDAGVPLEQISQLAGHSGTTVIELVYRHQLRPVIQTGAIVMDQLFSGNRRQAD
jgi:hypothetical protein